MCCCRSENGKGQRISELDRSRQPRQEVRRLHRRQRHQLRRGGRRNLRSARPERRGEVDAHSHARHAAAADVRFGDRQRLRHREAGERRAAVDRRHPAGDDDRSRAERRREPDHPCQAVRRTAAEARATDGGAARRGRADEVARSAGQEPVGRHAPARRDRARAGARAAHLFPRRADDRARSGVARRRLGDAPEDQVAARPDDPHHDALHGRSRQALRSHRHRRSRRAEGARLADEAEDVDSGQERHRGELRRHAGRLDAAAPGAAGRGERDGRGSRIPDFVAERAGDDAGAHGHGRAEDRDGSIAVGPEHDARRRVRPLHGARPARRAAGSQPEGIAGLHGAEAVMGRMWAIIERELRRFRRSPVLIIVSMVFPIVQLVVLGYAFGGNVKHLKLAIVDQDRGVPAVKVRELVSAVASGARTVDVFDYGDQGQALADLRNGRVNGVLTIPPEFSRRVLAKNEPRVALIEDNTDNFVSVALAGTLGGMLAAYSQPAKAPRIGGQASLDVVEIYPYVPYVQYLLPGSVVMSIFMMVMIGGGIIFIDDKARGLHEGYLVTPISKLELIAGFNISGTIKAVLAGMFLMLIGSVIAGIPDPFAPLRLIRLFIVIVVTAFALISMMFLLMVRVSDPLLPRAVFGVLNTLLYFPSGAVYPQQGFPGWMQVIAAIDPFTYAVHAFKSLLLKNTGFEAISV